MPDKKILIIEDEPFIVTLLADHLKKAGLILDLAQDAETGLEKTRAQHPDLVLLDLILPGMTGFDFLEKKRLEDSIANIPVLVLSNLGQKDEVDRARALGAVDFMVKAHFDLEEITTKVVGLLGGTTA